MILILKESDFITGIFTANDSQRRASGEFQMAIEIYQAPAGNSGNFYAPWTGIFSAKVRV